MGRRKDQAQFNMRLDRQLLKRLQIAAKDQDRSVNSEMVHRLEQSFAQTVGQDQLAALTENVTKLSDLHEMARAWLDLALSKLASDKTSLSSLLAGIAYDEPSDLAPPVPREAPRRSEPDQEPERGTARSRLPWAREPDDETDEQRQARLRATAEGFRRNAKRHHARGAHDKAAQAREWADELERAPGALTQGQAPHQPRSVSDQEPKLPIPQPRKLSK
jgi:hypothetical protein